MNTLNVGVPSMNDSNPHKVEDGRLADLVAARAAPTPLEVSLIADELLRLRDIMRRGTRVANQMRKLRWTTEHLLVKVEMLQSIVDGDMAMPAQERCQLCGGVGEVVINEGVASKCEACGGTGQR